MVSAAYPLPPLPVSWKQNTSRCYQMFTVSFRQIVIFHNVCQLTRDSSVGRAQDCSCYLAILRSPVQIRFAGSFYKLVFLKLDFKLLTCHKSHQLTRDSSVGRAEDCSCYLAILRSPVQIRFVGSFYKPVFFKFRF